MFKELHIIVLGKIAPASVGQISTSEWNGGYYSAELAIDGNLDTVSETEGEWGTDLWFKMKFDDFFCFFEVVIIQSHLNGNAYRMQGAKVFVVNRETGVESLCGVLKVNPVWTIEGQTYRFPCNLKCGDEVKVTVLHRRGNYDDVATIHMKEITVFGVGMSWILVFIESCVLLVNKVRIACQNIFK